MQPISPHAANVAAPTMAVLVRRASRKNTMKMAGVSLIAAAMPTPMPAVRPCETRRMSIRIRASRIRLIWPRNRVCHTGSSAIAAASMPAILIRDSRYPASFRIRTQGVRERRHREQVPEHPRHGERQRRGRHVDDGRER